MRAPKHFQKALRRIDPLLSARWVPECQRWGIFHSLPMHERADEAIERRASELYTELWKRGHAVTKRGCHEYAAQGVRDRELVFYVTEDDGAFRPLDGRALEKLRRMNYMRENWDIKDWRQYMDAKAKMLDDMRARAAEGDRQVVRRDKVFQQQAVDKLRGDPSTRAINVTQPDKPARYGNDEKGKIHAAP